MNRSPAPRAITPLNRLHTYKYWMRVEGKVLTHWRKTGRLHGSHD